MNETMMFKVLVGSRLYGTHTAKSDFDYKVVVLPSMDDLLMGKKLANRKEKPEGSNANSKMQAGEAETEYLPLQVFMDDLYNGQTYALELMFAFNQGLAERCNDHVLNNKVTVMMRELQDRFLNSTMKKMVGYAVAQSQLYGLKTERFTTLKKVVELLTEHLAFFPDHTTMANEDGLRNKLLLLPHVKPVMIENSAGGSALAPALDIVGKKFPLTNKVHTLLASLNGLLAGYGDRVASFEGEGVDWKALSHAVRITTQVLELSKTGKMTFPNAQADMLRDMKEGKMTLEDATTLLANHFNQIDAAVANSTLPLRNPVMDADFAKWKLMWLRAFYSGQL